MNESGNNIHGKPIEWLEQNLTKFSWKVRNSILIGVIGALAWCWSSNWNKNPTPEVKDQDPDKIELIIDETWPINITIGEDLVFINGLTQNDEWKYIIKDSEIEEIKAALKWLNEEDYISIEINWNSTLIKIKDFLNWKFTINNTTALFEKLSKDKSSYEYSQEKINLLLQFLWDTNKDWKQSIDDLYSYNENIHESNFEEIAKSILAEIWDWHDITPELLDKALFLITTQVIKWVENVNLNKQIKPTQEENFEIISAIEDLTFYINWVQQSITSTKDENGIFTHTFTYLFSKGNIPRW